MPRRAAPLLFCCLLALAACAGKSAAPRPEQAASPPADRTAALIEDSAQTLLELRRDSPHAMLDAAISWARGLVILPGVYRAGFFYSLQGGDGVLLARRPDGGWGAPAFVTLAGAGYGPQVGLERARLVLAVLDEDMLARILAGGLNLEATAGFDIVGVREEHERGSLSERPVLAFADGFGLMAGVALRGAVLGLNRERTARYHGVRPEAAEQVLRGTNAPGLEVFHLWSALVVEEEPGPAIVYAPGRTTEKKPEAGPSSAARMSAP